MAKDRYQYFRIEARELIEGLTAGLLALDRSGGDGRFGAVDRLLRLAHTLKGAARVVGVGAVADAAHALEGLLAADRAPGGLPAPLLAEEGLLLVDAMSAAVDRLDPAPAPADGPEPAWAPAAEPGVETVRVALGAMDGLLEELAEAASQLDGLQRQAAEWQAASRLSNSLVAALADAPAATRALASALAGRLEQTRLGLVGGLDRAAQELDDARERAQGLRLVPASLVFSQLERAARDAGRERGVPVSFEATGGETRLDGPVLLQLRDALLHGVRNAVAHGLELERDRLASGKPGVGRVRLHVERQGARVVFRCEDDGRGMDPAALRQAAVRLGLASAAEAAAATDEEALGWSFHAGLSTRGEVTELAGRGVGLDAVQAIADGLKGEATLSSEPGRGTALTLTVPISLAALPALLVEAAGQVAAMPLDAVVSTFRLAEADVTIVTGRRTTWHDGRSMPVVSLAEALAPGAVASTGSTASARCS
ncbi:Chemotaxis protein CheA [compost metagenome]